jgi:hypothetical protein
MSQMRKWLTGMWMEACWRRAGAAGVQEHKESCGKRTATSQRQVSYQTEQDKTGQIAREQCWKGCLHGV